ncbi:MAG: hypothetical protein OZ921_17745 [Sorangiineae bacterium]|nr:hypothetical protein [Polyangiaceae bacterium]MEB2324362.1 hypothetical protein [Sorangiineae bacterium]
MRLLSARLIGLGPFADVTFPFADAGGAVRRVSVIYGGGGVGKTTLLAAIASTRPGHAVVLPGEASSESQPSERAPLAAEGRVPCAICDWALGADEPARPHPIRVATPTVRVFDDDAREGLRRREQGHYDRQARAGGFALIAVSSLRWFSRQPLALSAPARTIARFDVRAPSALDDASRSDLARETKQALAYAEISSALELARGSTARFGALRDAMRHSVGTLAGLAGYSFLGLDAGSFEPMFSGEGGKPRSFDALPTAVRNLVALGALPVRTLAAAYPGVDPREAEGVVLVDEADASQDPACQAGLARALGEALPGAQWLLTTSSPRLAASAEASEVMALRRPTDAESVELHVGAAARTH